MTTLVTKLRDVEIKSDIDRLILLMRHLGIKQYELAKELGYARVYVESVINGRSPLTAPFQRRIDEYLVKRQKENQNNAEKMCTLSHRSKPTAK